jgi:hypothetical protein
MIDFVRKNIVIITALILGWSGWGFLDEGSAKPEANAKAAMTAIPAACLALRDVAASLPAILDPYHCERFPSVTRVDPAAGKDGKEGQAPADASPRGGGKAPTAAKATANPRVPSAGSGKAAPKAGTPTEPPDTTSAGASAAVTAANAGRPALPPALPFELPSSSAQLAALIFEAGATHALDMRDVVAHAALLSAPPVAMAKAAPAEPAPVPRRSFALVLQSTIDMPDARQARLCGRTVMEGETMPFLDATEPPLLEKVMGSSAVVLYGGRRYELDVNACPVVMVGEPAAEKPAAPAGKGAAAYASQSAAGKPAKASKAAAAAAPAAKSAGAGAAKGAYRVRGKNKKP